VSEHADSFHKKIEDDRRGRVRFFCQLKGEMVFSPAFNEISRKGSSVAVLIHILFRQPFPPKAKERKRLERAGLWPRPPEEFSFPIREAKHHGMSEWALSQGLETLHRVGFIDRRHPGSGAKRGDFARYILSERWRKWGGPDFNAIPWEKAATVGIRGEGGKFIRRRIGKREADDAFVAVKDTATKGQTAVKYTATTPHVAVKNTANRPPKGAFVAVKSTVLLSSPYAPGLGSGSKEVKNGSKDAAGAFAKPEALPEKEAR